MAECKACGEWFSSTQEKDELCAACEKALKRLGNYVVPVIPAQWEHLYGDEWFCTHCGFVVSTEGSWEKPEKKFCEECGAKMQMEDAE